MPSLTSIFLPEKCRHLLLSRSEQQQLEATDLLQIDLLDSTAVLRCFLSRSLSLRLWQPFPDGSSSVSERKCYSGKSKPNPQNSFSLCRLLELRCRDRMSILKPIRSNSKSQHLNWRLSTLNRYVPDLQGQARTLFTRSTSRTGEQKITMSMGSFPSHCINPEQPFCCLQSPLKHQSQTKQLYKLCLMWTVTTSVLD